MIDQPRWGDQPARISFASPARRSGHDGLVALSAAATVLSQGLLLQH
ncbi:hypothetical protein SynBIOSE41_01418 [Synechococcus sp. BIOS-E4-1]|nr:hypothetical protein SynBIOSE41_01418 [Synechococcus sp. BIOS-E4-1]